MIQLFTFRNCILKVRSTVTACLPFHRILYTMISVDFRLCNKIVRNYRCRSSFYICISGLAGSLINIFYIYICGNSIQFRFQADSKMARPPEMVSLFLNETHSSWRKHHYLIKKFRKLITIYCKFVVGFKIAIKLNSFPVRCFTLPSSKFSDKMWLGKLRQLVFHRSRYESARTDQSYKTYENSIWRCGSCDGWTEERRCRNTS